MTDSVLHERQPSIELEPRGREWGTDATAQDVIDALRFCLMAQSDPVKVKGVVEMLLVQAPVTDGDRGISLILEFLSEGSLKVEVTDA